MPKLILEYRGLSKLKSTYTDKLPLEINSRTGRIHTSYHQAVAATGRLSSAGPQPAEHTREDAEGRRIRQASSRRRVTGRWRRTIPRFELRIWAPPVR